MSRPRRRQPERVDADMAAVPHRLTPAEARRLAASLRAVVDATTASTPAERAHAADVSAAAVVLDLQADPTPAPGPPGGPRSAPQRPPGPVTPGRS